MNKKINFLCVSLAVIFTLLIPFAICFANIHVGAESYTADPNWYSADKSILEINDIPDFIAFMEKMNELGTGDNGSTLGVPGNLAGISWSGKMPFEGQTIVLNTDIVLNPGVTFTEQGPSKTAYVFSRTTKQVGFGGIFDGQGHTVSGLYITSNKGGSGSIFGVGGAATKATNVVVKNLQIKNSLIENSAMGVASIFSGVAFNSHVLIENVYSEAIVKSTATTVSEDAKLKTSIIGANMGGFCGTVGGNLSIINSIYAGTFVADASKTPKKYVGGMVGNITNKELKDGSVYSGNLTVENSAYYGKFEGSGVYIGKLSGDQTAGSTVTVNNSIFGGTMKSTASFTPGSGASSNASTYFVGRLIGYCSTNYTQKIANTVATSAYKGNTAVSNFNAASSANSGSSVSVEVLVESNLTTKNLDDRINFNWVANGTMNGYPVPASYITLFGEESLKHNYITTLPLSARELFEQLDTKIANDGIYTEDSYRRYSDAYDGIVSLIFADNTNLAEINVAELKANAEAKLMTPADERRLELKDVLGSKISNINKDYTEDSYSKYSDAYDAIVDSLNNATTVEELNKINVTELKANAEALLVKYVPKVEPEEPKPEEPKPEEPKTEEPGTEVSGTEVPETDDSETGTGTSTETEIVTEIVTEISEDTESEEPLKKKKGRCGSTVTLSALGLVVIMGVAVVIKKED